MSSPTRLRELLAPTDPAILEAGAGGERFIAAVRVIHWSAVWMIPVATLFAMDAPPPEVWIGFVASSLALLISAGFLLLARRYRGATFVPFVTAAFDVTLVSVTLAAIAAAGRPSVAVNSHVIWPIYMLAIVATAFRLDFRVCALAGALAAGEYLALVFWVTARWSASLAAAGDYGTFTWALQVAKLLLLLVATALTGAIIHQARRFAAISGSDRLTGLGNRALFEEKVRIELARAEREELPLTLAFLDLDRFKTFNDRFGHDAGDRALRLVADTLRAELRVTDHAFRWGGEELIVLLPATDTDGAAVVLERVRGVLRATPLPGVPGEVRVAVSIGTSEFPREAASAEALLARADARLLIAKRSGRDRIVSADSAGAIRRVS